MKKINNYENLKDIEKTFSLIGGDKKTLGMTLLDEAFFCGETLKKLKAQIKLDGIVDDMCQGSYSIKRENPALRSYNTLVKNYQSLIKQITDLIGNQEPTKENDPLEEFIK